MEKQKFLSREWYEAKYTQWQNEIEKWHESGEPITEWCREMGISKKTFYRWRVKLGDVKPAKLSKNVFEPVKCQNHAKFTRYNAKSGNNGTKRELGNRNTQRNFGRNDLSNHRNGGTVCLIRVKQNMYTSRLATPICVLELTD